MGKNLKGKECGKGICQRKDGLYTARFVNKRGVRQEKFFSKIPEARNWLDDARYADKHDNVFVPSDMTVDTWLTIGLKISLAISHLTRCEITVNDIKYLTLEEQEKFMEVAKRSHNYYQYALLLETGLRTGEKSTL